MAVQTFFWNVANTAELQIYLLPTKAVFLTEELDKAFGIDRCLASQAMELE